MRRSGADSEASHSKLSRRAVLLGSAQLLFMGGLAARMNYLQVDQADQFRLLAEENRINIRLIPPARGEIFDRNGVRLAQNVPSYRIVIVREDADDVDAVMDRLGKVIDLDPEMRDRAMAERAGVSRFMTKPFSNVEVLTAVRDLVAQASRQ